jgi:hypothetical protein
VLVGISKHLMKKKVSMVTVPSAQTKIVCDGVMRITHAPKAP